MAETPASEIEHFLRLLAETPQGLVEAAAGLDETQLAASPAPAAWSALTILAHLRSCADVWSASIGRMLAEEQPRINEIHPRQNWKKVDYTQDGYCGGCAQFAAQRQALLEKLAPLPPEAWQRGSHIKGRQHTVFSHVRRMALHEHGHLEQIRALSLSMGLSKK
jgi:hypothetical protein